MSKNLDVVPAAGSRRRVQGLLWQGFGYARQSVEFSTSTMMIATPWIKWLVAVHRSGSDLMVARPRAARIAEVTDWLLTQPPVRGPAGNYARSVALRAEAVPIDRWPPGGIDDPDAVPLPVVGPEWDWVVVERAMAGQLTWGFIDPMDRVEAIRRMLAEGRTITAIANAMKVSVGTVSDFVQRNLADQRALATA